MNIGTLYLTSMVLYIIDYEHWNIVPYINGTVYHWYHVSLGIMNYAV